MILALLATLGGAVAPAPLPYAQIRGHVAAGGEAVLFVGLPAADPPAGGVWGRVPSLPGIAPGVYRCYRLGGEPVMERQPEPARTVAAVAPADWFTLQPWLAGGVCVGSA